MLNRGTNVLPTTVAIDGGQASVNPVPVGEDGVFASSVIDRQKNEIIVKVINTTAAKQPITINISGLKTKAMPATAAVTSLDCSNYDAENMPSKPEVVSPAQSQAPVAASKAAAAITATIPAKTFQVYKVKI